MRQNSENEPKCSHDLWSIRNEQKSETENGNDWKINRSFLLGLPCKFKYWNQKKYNKNY